MIYRLYHWYKGYGKHHPDAFEFDFYEDGKIVRSWAVRVTDVHKWINDYGYPVMIVPPTTSTNYWQLWIADGFRFDQK